LFSKKTKPRTSVKQTHYLLAAIGQPRFARLYQP
jgi:hypothetical protein